MTNFTDRVRQLHSRAGAGAAWLEKALFTLYDSDHDHRLEMGDFVRFYEAIDTSGKDHVTEDQYKAYFITVKILNHNYLWFRDLGT
ncbi:hypothetical protein C0Q70_03498 [Pomacea canaliculata]|uniref:EF-hand domain-containing protein n=1 Tax=Pomacea canaliculata TaxID=400727 RepID=A0A2T7PSV5_POMCA|nr:hypothetical protein C0Q70_03498 [Pomacea canaliculata]